ncbi:Dihydrolipoamide acetyltransferase component of pyruvate dehydrogenase complex [Melia azedarach]|uniref:Dihydrolipoamide acetyltransferase component of pyruvate dehydrogenase complex n=1 Tax=Melia azedarach TaxID=155640 RepID=A0ACC1Z244_MELAZ|nr:Dihydrolipoamide acetyltransferase component of pyruvate dehydrogenase complex [Melia azedarach]
MIWGIIRRKITSAQVIGQSFSKIRPRCYTTAQKEVLVACRGIQRVQSSSYHIFSGNYVSSTPWREATELIGKESLFGLRSRPFSSDSGDLVDAVVPFMGESITDGTLVKFLKQPGDRVEVDEPIAQIETDKVTIDVASPDGGVIQKLVAKEGETVEPGTKIAVISKSGEGATQATPAEKAAPQPPPAEEKQTPKAEAAPAVKDKAPSPQQPTTKKPTSPPSKPMASEPQLPPKDKERRVPMTRLRKRVATRLKDSQNTFAMLTTFNEVDMTNLMKLRSDYKDVFVEKHGVKLGLMSGFIKAAVSALQHQPVVNAVIDGDDIIYRDYS